MRDLPQAASIAYLHRAETLEGYGTAVRGVKDSETRRRWMQSRMRTAALFLGLAQDLKSFEQRITTKVLPNGLTLIICERPDAPVFSYSTFIDAGDVNDPSGESGLAHMFEHLAFKGTSQIGTTDYAAEKVALAKVEAPTTPMRPST
jgi:hypothetical protein